MECGTCFSHGVSPSIWIYTTYLNVLKNLLLEILKLNSLYKDYTVVFVFGIFFILLFDLK